MEEFYIDTIADIELNVYTGGSLVDPDGNTVNIVIKKYETGEVMVSGEATRDSIGSFSYTLASPIMDEEALYQVDWSYSISGNSVTPTIFFETVRPYVLHSEIVTEFPELSTLTFEEVKAMERTVRKVINAYTNQSFGPTGSKTFRLYGSGSNHLTLPMPIYDLEFVAAENPRLVLFDKTVNGDGWILERDEDGVVIDPETPYANGEVEIVVWNKELPWTIGRKYDAVQWPIEPKTPLFNITRNIFEDKRMYLVRASTGWPYVPNEVNQAAKLLINDYFQPDAAYHLRGIDVASAADYRLEWNSDPYSTTGNVIADQLLAKYVNWNIQVL